MKKIILSTALAVCTALSATQTYAASVISHNTVKSIWGADGNSVYKKWLPKLRSPEGCIPYPAVESDGDWSGGLQDSGSASGDCKGHGQTQVYARHQCWWESGEFCAFLYTWYFPKDNGSPVPTWGHRHDWEGVVLTTLNGTVRSVSFSGHGNWTKYWADKLTFVSNSWGGKSVLVDYDYFGSVTHSLDAGTINTGSFYEPLAIWNYMPSAARTSLTNANFGSATVMIKDSKFWSNLKAAIVQADCSNYTTMC
jgi:hypothetical protein